MMAKSPGVTRLAASSLVVLALALVGCQSAKSPDAAPASATSTPAGDLPPAEGSQDVEIPDVVGLRLDDAEGAFEAAGFDTLDVETPNGNHMVGYDPAEWVVIAQDPPVGAAFDIRTVITLRVEPAT